MSRDVERVDRATLASRSQAAHARAADLVDRQAKVNRTLDSFFREVAEVRELLKAEGSLWAGPVLDPPVEAAFREWTTRGPKETRIELDRLSEAPMMGLEELPESDFA